jgi:hypothetical protein
MRHAKPVCTGLIASFILAGILAGCSSAGVAPGVQNAGALDHPGIATLPAKNSATSQVLAQHRGWMSRAARTGPVLFISDDMNNIVNVYSQKGTDQSPIGQLAGSPSAPLEGPTGVAVDAQGNVYVSNYDNNEVPVFKKGASTPFEELNALSTNYGGNDIAVYSAASSTTVYVANYPNEIQVFTGGSLNPTSTLTDADVSYLYSIAVDSLDDVFDIGSSLSTGALEVDEFPANSSTATVLPIDVDGCDEYGGLALDANNDLYVDCSPVHVSEYAPPYTESPVRTIPYSGGYTLGLALNKADKALWLTSYGQLEGLEYTLKGKLKDNTSSTGLVLPWGMALSPASSI